MPSNVPDTPFIADDIVSVSDIVSSVTELVSSDPEKTLTALNPVNSMVEASALEDEMHQSLSIRPQAINKKRVHVSYFLPILAVMIGNNEMLPLKFNHMRKSLLSIIFTTVLIGNALAQGQVDEAKYEIIRETIHFLATDNRVSRDTGFRIACETLDYDCFKQQLSSNTIAGIDQWYNRWRSAAVTDEAALVAFRDRVLADILDRPGKAYRKELAGYESYRARVDQLARLPVGEIPAEQAVADTDQAAAFNAPEIRTTYPPDTADQPESPESGSNGIAYIALVIGLLALVLAAWQRFGKNTPQSADGIQDIHERLDELSARVRRLETKTEDSQMGEAVTSLTDIMESIEKRVVELENGSKPDMR